MAGALPARALLQAYANDSPLAGRVTSSNVSPSGCTATACCEFLLPSRNVPERGRKKPPAPWSAPSACLPATPAASVSKCELVDASRRAPQC